MSQQLEFETPENVKVSYTIAGPGTRFVAYVFDMLLMFVTMIVVGLIFLLINLALPEVALGVGRFFGHLAGVMVVLSMGLGYLLYFLLFEFFMHGQTPGKRSVKARVVSAQGFSLSFGALFIRNIFRVLDSIPLLWLVPVFSEQTQRLGDLVAGTVVIEDAAASKNALSMQLAQRTEDEATFTFSSAQLALLEEKDTKALESFLSRTKALPPEQGRRMAKRLARVMGERIGVPPEDYEGRSHTFLIDLMTAHSKRQLSELE